MRFYRGQNNAFAVKGLYSDKRRAVLLLQQIRAYFQDIVGPQADEISVKRGMVQRAESESISN